MDYDPETPPEPLDKAAQKRAVDAVLTSGLAAAGVAGAVLALLLFAPGLAEIAYAGWALWGAIALAGAVHACFQLHYMMRFMWGRGEWVTMHGPDWGDHENYFTSLIIVTGAAIVVMVALAGVNSLLPRG